ncbi:serine hydrolase domain-containing protein [Roseivirga thermotolerans]|uniref:serine hydrolase domain-containing protein n=1 Tax=Roseivirga thermotolerans TaxID=1758176 RepID=UPI0027E45C5B|nr:serine hydrolase domain-containing protein [Roseivirga thermotolerans]
MSSAETVENADRITLEQLVQHRSGIPTFTDSPDFRWDKPFKNNEKTLELVLNKPARFEHGLRYEYSNTNYLLLGHILGNTLGYSHHQYIEEAILHPLQLKSTSSLLSQANPERVMSGYVVGWLHDVKGNDFIEPGASMVATAKEVGLFLTALHNGSLLNKKEQSIYAGLYSFEHTGLLPGYQSLARYYADIDVVIIQFTNTSGGKAWSFSEIMHKRLVRI